MGALDAKPLVHPENREAWRAWLAANHATSSGVWLVSWRRASGRQPLEYEVAIEEALCFGWVDGQAATIDADRSKLYFAPRRPRSVWAGTNKARVARLTAAGRMTPAGIDAVERAKRDGSWTILDSVERMELPAELDAALRARPPALANWAAFTPSARRALLAWVAMARRDETRTERIDEIAAAAQRNERANEPPRDRGSGRSKTDDRA